MKFQKHKPTLFTKKGGEVGLSGPALIELLKAVLDKGSCFRFRAKGFSMSPFVRNNDSVTIAPLQKILPRIGDVVAFINPATKKLIIHRITEKRGNFYLIKGDSIKEADDLVPQANILGCVKRVERNGKRVSLGLGPERFFIAWLTHTPLPHLLRKLRRLVRHP